MQQPTEDRLCSYRKKGSYRQNCFLAKLLAKTTLPKNPET